MTETGGSARAAGVNRSPETDQDLLPRSGPSLAALLIVLTHFSNPTWLMAATSDPSPSASMWVGWASPCSSSSPGPPLTAIGDRSISNGSTGSCSQHLPDVLDRLVLATLYFFVTTGAATAVPDLPHLHGPRRGRPGRQLPGAYCLPPGSGSSGSSSCTTSFSQRFCGPLTLPVVTGVVILAAYAATVIVMRAAPRATPRR